MSKKIVFIKDTSLGSKDSTREFFTHFFDAIHKQGLLEEVQIVRAADMGIYDHGMVMRVYPDNIIYHRVQDSDIERIIEETIKNNVVINELVYRYEPIQLRIVLRNLGQ